MDSVDSTQLDEEGYEITKDEGFFKIVSNWWTIYERRTMMLIGLQYCNQGGSLMMMLACTLYFLSEGIQPV